MDNRPQNPEISRTDQLFQLRKRYRCKKDLHVFMTNHLVSTNSDFSSDPLNAATPPSKLQELLVELHARDPARCQMRLQELRSQDAEGPTLARAGSHEDLAAGDTAARLQALHAQGVERQQEDRADLLLPDLGDTGA